MTDIDSRVRLAAFAFLEEQLRAHQDSVLPRTILVAGFTFEGQRVPLMGPQGIFKPAVLLDMPLTITSVPVVEGQARPYDDMLGDDGLLRYRYRGTDPNHPENVGLRRAMARQMPLIYFHGIVPGLYQADWPVYVVGDNQSTLTFTVSVDERQLARLEVPPVENPETDARRRYVTRLMQQRAHQSLFRHRVLNAYRRHCAVCRLQHDELLEAAHILPDGHPKGEPVVPNGLALCKLHHAAFDAHILGVTPNYSVEVRLDILEETDGPMLLHGLQGFHQKRLVVPHRQHLQPSREFLEERYALFRKAG
jgi:putative restriction endonuclease